VEIQVTDKMLREFSYLLKTNPPKASCAILLKDYLEDLDINKVNDGYMKDQAIAYYIQGPAWRHSDDLLDRAWLKGFEAACRLASQPITLSFTIDQYCSSKINTLMPKAEE
jgi:hypothetical protein